MPSADEYIRNPDGTWELPTHQNHQPILKNDGWNARLSTRNETNNPSHLAPSPRKLTVISARQAIEGAGSGSNSLWGHFLYEKSTGILNSVAGVGKTTLCYNVGVYGARGEPFGNMPFLKPLNVLYADLETSRELRGTKLELISEGNPPDNLYFLPNLNFIGDYHDLEQIVLEYSIDLLIVDTINEAFETRDEQDNAEANRQFTYMKRLRDETGCSVLLLAHIGKGEQAHKVYSTRGASARAGAVDVVLNLTEVTEDTVCLSKEKDRIGGGKEKLYLRKAGEDAFEVVERGEDQEIGLLIRAERFVLDLIDEGATQTGQFIEGGKQAGYSQPTIERGLTNLRKAGKIERIKKGIYQKATEASKPNNYSGDDLKSDGCSLPSENPSITNNPSVDGFDGFSQKEQTER